MARLAVLACVALCALAVAGSSSDSTSSTAEAQARISAKGPLEYTVYYGAEADGGSIVVEKFFPCSLFVHDYDTVKFVAANARSTIIASGDASTTRTTPYNPANFDDLADSKFTPISNAGASARSFIIGSLNNVADGSITFYNFDRPSATFTLTIIPDNALAPLTPAQVAHEASTEAAAAVRRGKVTKKNVVEAGEKHSIQVGGSNSESDVVGFFPDEVHIKEFETISFRTSNALKESKIAYIKNAQHLEKEQLFIRLVDAAQNDDGTEFLYFDDNSDVTPTAFVAGDLITVRFIKAGTYLFFDVSQENGVFNFVKVVVKDHWLETSSSSSSSSS